MRSGFQPQTLRALYRARCLTEALIPVAESLAARPPPSLQKQRTKRLSGPYRVELRGLSGRTHGVYPALTHALKGGDNPSRYLDELRVVCHGSGLCDVFVKPCNVPDHRFDYRRQAISASIAPAPPPVWRGMHSLSAGFRRPNPRIRPFCGSGTLLFELEKAAPGSVLLGTDLSATALFAARTNAKAARSRAQFTQRDILRFEPKETVLIYVLTNMPFGNPRGIPRNERAALSAVRHLLPKLLIPGGVALLYTMEHRLLVACLKSDRSLTVAAELTTEAGGLNPRGIRSFGTDKHVSKKQRSPCPARNSGHGDRFNFPSIIRFLCGHSCKGTQRMLQFSPFVQRQHVAHHLNARNTGQFQHHFRASRIEGHSSNRIFSVSSAASVKRSSRVNGFFNKVHGGAEHPVTRT